MGHALDISILTYGLASGIGLVSISILLFFKKLIFEKKYKFRGISLKKTIATSKIAYNLNYFMNKRLNKIKRKEKLSKKEKAVVIMTSLLLTGTATSIKTVFTTFITGLLIGFLLVKLFRKIIKDIHKAKKLREVAILYESVEIYTKAGYSLVQALRASKILTDLITPAIDKCLNNWNRGSKVALEILRQELDLKESDATILLMLHMEKVGSKNLHGMLKNRADAIKNKQMMEEEIKISKRPLILVLYKILPLGATMGIIIGSLLYRVYSMFIEMGLIM